MAPPLTSEMWRIGSRNALICGFGAILLIVPLALYLSHVLGSSVFLTLIFLCAVGSTASFVAYLLLSVRGRLRAGSVLLDCGPSPMRWVFWLCGTMFLTYGTAKILGINTDGDEPLEFWIHIWFVIFSSFYFLMAVERLQLRDEGIWQFGSLLRWDRFESYEWAGESRCTLTYHYNSWLPIFGKGAVAFRDEHVQAVDDLLKRHVAGTSDADLTGTSPS